MFLTIVIDISFYCDVPCYCKWYFTLASDVCTLVGDILGIVSDATSTSKWCLLQLWLILLL
jgi:hypothetical protein